MTMKTEAINSLLTRSTWFTKNLKTRAKPCQELFNLFTLSSYTESLLVFGLNPVSPDLRCA